MRLIDADALKDDILKSAVMIDDRGIQTGYEIAIELIKRQPTIDVIPVSFIQELIDRDKQLIEEYGGKQDYEIIVDGLIERVVNYKALIEKWREKNGTKTD